MTIIETNEVLNEDCLHESIMYDKIEDKNYCEKCGMKIFEDESVLFFEREELEDIEEHNLEELNNL